MVSKRKEKVSKEDKRIEIPKSVTAPRPRPKKVKNEDKHGSRRVEGKAHQFHALKHAIMAPVIAKFLLQRRFPKLTAGLDVEETLLLSDQEDSVLEARQNVNGSDKENLGQKGKGKRKAKSTASSSNDGDSEHREDWRGVFSDSD